MNTFLKNAVLVLTASGLLAAGSALADKQQGGRDWKQSRPSVEDVLARMSESLDLSDEQSVELLVILQQHAAEKKALHEQSWPCWAPRSAPRELRLKKTSSRFSQRISRSNSCC